MVQKEKLAIGVLCIVAFLIALYFLLSYQEIAWDSAQYLKIAEYWYNGNPVFKDLIFPPLLSFFEYLIFLVFGVDIVVVKVFYAIFLPLLILFVYKLVSFLQNKKAGLIASCLVLLSHVIMFWSTRLYTDTPLIFLVVLGTYLFLVAVKKNSKKYYILSGVVFGLSFLMKPVSIVLSLGIIGFYLILNKKINVKILFLLSGLIVLIPWLIYMQIETNDAFYVLKGHYSGFVDGERNIVRNANVFLSSTNIFWIALVILGIYSIKNIKDLRIIAFVFSLFLFLLMPFGDERYAIPPIVFGCMVAGSIKLQNLKISLKYSKLFFLLILFIIAFLNLPRFVFREFIFIHCSKDSALESIGEFLQKNSKEDSIIFAENYWAQIEFYSKRDVYAMIEEATWLDDIIEQEKTNYIVIIDKETKIKYLSGFNLIKDFKDNCRTLYLYGR